MKITESFLSNSGIRINESKDSENDDDLII